MSQVTGLARGTEAAVQVEYLGSAEAGLAGLGGAGTVEYVTLAGEEGGRVIGVLRDNGEYQVLCLLCE